MEKERLLVAVYSPVCEANGAFLGLLKEWAQEAGAEVEAVPFHQMGDRERAWYRKAGRLDSGSFRQTVFIDVFLEGELVDSVPLNRERIASALGVPIKGSEVDLRPPSEETSPEGFLSSLLSGRIQPVAITRDTYRREMDMCLENYPFGEVDGKFHASCRALKEPVFLETFQTQEIAGVFLKDSRDVLGLLEVHPREVLRKYGFVTGTGGSDQDYLTVGCYEVGRGLPRAEVVDRLMAALLKLSPRLGRPLLEGVGKLNWPGGFNPYWVYDKYGFSAVSELRPGWILMEKRVSS